MGQAAHGSLEQSLIHDSRYHDTLRESEYPISRVLSPRTCSKLPYKNSPLPFKASQGSLELLQLP